MARALHVFAGLPSAGRVRLSVVWSRLELDGGGARFFSRGDAGFCILGDGVGRRPVDGGARHSNGIHSCFFSGARKLFPFKTLPHTYAGQKPLSCNLNPTETS